MEVCTQSAFGVIGTIPFKQKRTAKSKRIPRLFCLFTRNGSMGEPVPIRQALSIYWGCHLQKSMGSFLQPVVFYNRKLYMTRHILSDNPVIHLHLPLKASHLSARNIFQNNSSIWQQFCFSSPSYCRRQTMILSEGSFLYRFRPF